MLIRPIQLTRSAIDSEFGRLFDTLWRDMPVFNSAGPAKGFPALNIWEDESAVHVEAELPGFGVGDIEITVVNNELTISGQREERVAEGATVHRRERLSGRFSRAVRLGTRIDSERVTATSADGVLRVTLPKAQEARARRITVSARE